MIKLTVGSLGEKYMQEYTLTKKIENRFKTDSIEGNIIYQGDQHVYLVNAASQSMDQDEGVFSSMCGDVEWTRDAKVKHTKGTFDLQFCMTTKKPEFINDLDCVVDKEVNIFDYTKTNTKTIQGVLDREYGYQEVLIVRDPLEISPKLTLNDVLNLIGTVNDLSGEGYYLEFCTLLMEPILIESEDPQFGTTIGYTGHRISIQATYVRLFSGTQLSPEWIATDGGYYYPIGQDLNNWSSENYTEIPVFSADTFNGNTYQNSFWTIGRTNQYIDITISNTYSLNEILEGIFECTGKTLISNWYGINPDGTAPGNQYYDFANLYCQNMKLVQSFDIIRESALEDSFDKSGLISVKDLLSDLLQAHNLVVIPDDSAIRLEHVTYYTRKGFNAKIYDYEFEPLELNKDLIDGELFSWAINFNNTNFFQADINYRTSNIFSDPNKPTYPTKKLVADVFSAINNETYNSSEYEKLFFLLATDGTSIIGLNRNHAMPNLVTKLHNLNRPLKKGTINGVPTTFRSYSIGFEGTVKMVANILVWDQLEPWMHIDTHYGIFLIEEIEVDQDKTLTLKIKK